MSARNFREELTKKIIAQLEAGTAPWVRPWDSQRLTHAAPHNVLTGRPYHGGNRLWLDCQGFTDPRWVTYKQAAMIGCQVKKGEHATVVEYWQWEREEQDEAGQKITVKLDAPRVFYAHVFNAGQIQGIPPLPEPDRLWKPETAAENILRNSCASISHDQRNRAFYSPVLDQIHLPRREAFPDAGRYYATALHELGHWTGHSTRLGRDLKHGFGSIEYAQEELRAELASFFLASQIGTPHDPGQHAAYIKSWITLLQSDPHEIFRAAKDAEAITEFVLQFQQTLEAQPIEEAELAC